MRTKKKLLITLTSLFALTACNDDNSSNNGQVTSPKTEQWTQVKVPGFALTEDSEDTSEYSAQTLTINDGKLYIKNYHPNPLTQNDQITYTTADSIYTAGEINKDYGTYIGDITTSNTAWVLKPYSPINLKGLEIKTELTSIDLANKDILESIEPYIAINQKNVPETDDLFYTEKDHILLNRFKDKKFPVGAACLQIKNISQNEDTLELTANPKYSTDISTWYELYDEYSSSADAHVFFKNTEALLISDPTNMSSFNPKTLAYIPYNVSAKNGVAKYDGKAYSAVKINKGIRFDPTLTQNYNIASFEYIEQIYPESQLVKQLKDAFAQSCDYLNPTATKAIYDILGSPNYQ